MGVFIKGMDMPRVCAQCFMDPPCMEALSGEIRIWEERHPDCPLVEVKEPHGDLVDRGEILEEYDRQHKGPVGGARKIMETAKTVIGSEVEVGKG